MSTDLSEVIRVEWFEDRPYIEGGFERFLVLAEGKNGKWNYERSTWDFCWYPLTETPEIRQRLEIELIRASE